MPGQQYKGPLDYIDVATRIVEFREKFPEGSLQQQDLQFVEFANSSWVVYTAAAYRTPDDQRPGVGTAWEPVPGKTSFTRDSELQNAETAAWGRAIVAALAADTKQGIASSQEVRNRQQEAPAEKPAPPQGWEQQVAAITTIEELQAFYENAAKAQWVTTPVNRLISARKRDIEAAAAA